MIPEARMRIAGLVSTADAIIESRELQSPGEWAMTAFSRYRVLELLGVEPVPPYVGIVDVSPAALIEEATRVAEQLAPSGEHLAWHASLVEALRCALVDVRMVSGACDL